MYNPSGSGQPHADDNQLQTYSNDSTNSDRLLFNLKKNYEQRIYELETQIGETYNLIERDETIRAMKMSRISDDFVRQRIGEVIDEALIGEKEAQIEKLNDINAELQTEYERLGEENQKYEQTLEEYRSKLEQEETVRVKIEEEFEALRELVKGMMEQNEEAERIKEMCNEKDEVIDEMRKDMQTLQEEYMKLEDTNGGLDAEYKNLLRLVEDYSGKAIHDEIEIRGLREDVIKLEEENRIMRLELDSKLKENSELVNRSEYISVQVKKLVEDGHKNASEMVEEVKAKYKERLEESVLGSESMKREISKVEQERDELKAAYENQIERVKADMSTVKREWEKKCQDLEVKFEKERQVTIVQYQADLQAIMQKKVREIQEEADGEILRLKNLESESREQYNKRLVKYEKEYMQIAEHEEILSIQVMELKSKHLAQIKDIEDKVEREAAEKLRNLIRASRQEYEDSIESLKNQNRGLEQKLVDVRGEHDKWLAETIKEKERAQRLHVQLEDAKSTYKNLQEELNDTRQSLNRLRSAYEEELRRAKKSSLEAEEHGGRAESLKKREAELTTLIKSLREEILSLEEQNFTQGETLSKSINQNKSLKDELELVRISLEATEKEKRAHAKKAAELECDLTDANYRERERNELLNRLEREKVDSGKAQEALNLAEGRIKALEVKLNSKQETERVLGGRKEQLEEELRVKIRKERELEGEVGGLKEYVRDLETRLGKSEKFRVRKIDEIRKMVARECEVMRQSVRRVQGDVVEELEEGRRGMEELVVMVGKEIGVWKVLWEAEWGRKMRKIADEENKGKLEEAKIREDYVRMLEGMEKEVKEVKRESEEARKEAEEERRKVVEGEKKVKKLEEEGEKLREASRRKVEEFRELQGFVEGELKRLKGESDVVARDEKVRMKQEISGLVSAVERMRGKRVEKLEEIEEEVERMKKAQERAIEDVKVWYRRRVSEMEEVVDETRNEVVELRKELRRAEDKSKDIKEESRRTAIVLEEKLIRVMEDMGRREKENEDENFGGITDRVREGLNEKEREREKEREKEREREVLRKDTEAIENRAKEVARIIEKYGGSKKNESGSKRSSVGENFSDKKLEELVGTERGSFGSKGLSVWETGRGSLKVKDVNI